MIARLSTLFVVATLAACHDSVRVAAATDASAPAPSSATATPAFRITDSIVVRDDEDGHTLARLWRGDALIDTVDRDFGVVVLGADSVVYRAATNVRQDDGESWGDLGAITLYARGTRVALDDRVPGLQSFSAPAVIAGALYYWRALAHADSDSTRALWARRYDIRTGAADSLLLARGDSLRDDWHFEADGHDVFSAPYRDGSDVLFVLDSAHVWRWRTR